MEKHPMAKTPVKIRNGKLKNRFFIVEDWLVNQFQGKQVEKIAKAHPGLVQGVRSRKQPLDDKLVYGKMYPDMYYTCVHDDELQDAEPAEFDVDNVVSLVTRRKEKENGTSKTSGGDNQAPESGESEPDGRSVSGTEDADESAAEAEGQGHSDSTSGSGAGSEGTVESGRNQRKAPARARTATKTGRKGSK